MSDRMCLGTPAVSERWRFNEIAATGAELRRKVTAGRYTGLFSLTICEGVPFSEVEAFFPEDVWPGPTEFQFRLPGGVIVDGLHEPLPEVRRQLESAKAGG